MTYNKDKYLANRYLNFKQSDLEIIRKPTRSSADQGVLLVHKESGCSSESKMYSSYKDNLKNAKKILKSVIANNYLY